MAVHVNGTSFEKRGGGGRFVLCAGPILKIELRYSISGHGYTKNRQTKQSQRPWAAAVRGNLLITNSGGVRTFASAESAFDAIRAFLQSK